MEKEKCSTAEWRQSYTNLGMEIKTMTIKLSDLTILQDAYLVTPYTYEALAEDKNGNPYLVIWEILDSFKEAFKSGDYDESEACEWDNPAEIIAL